MWDPPICQSGFHRTHTIKWYVHLFRGPRGDPLLKWEPLTHIYIVWWDHVSLEWWNLHIGGPMWDSQLKRGQHMSSNPVGPTHSRRTTYNFVGRYISLFINYR
jgi:hypothetical protein